MKIFKIHDFYLNIAYARQQKDGGSQAKKSKITLKSPYDMQAVLPTKAKEKLNKD
jgi:hypothetical protein